MLYTHVCVCVYVSIYIFFFNLLFFHPILELEIESESWSLPQEGLNLSNRQDFLEVPSILEVLCLVGRERGTVGKPNCHFDNASNHHSSWPSFWTLRLCPNLDSLRTWEISLLREGKPGFWHFLRMEVPLDLSLGMRSPCALLLPFLSVHNMGSPHSSLHEAAPGWEATRIALWGSFGGKQGRERVVSTNGCQKKFFSLSSSTYWQRS